MKIWTMLIPSCMVYNVSHASFIKLHIAIYKICHSSTPPKIALIALPLCLTTLVSSRIYLFLLFNTSFFSVSWMIKDGHPYSITIQALSSSDSMKTLMCVFQNGSLSYLEEVNMSSRFFLCCWSPNGTTWISLTFITKA